MAFKYADRIAETSTTTGTSDFALAGAINHFRPFSAAYTDGDTMRYAAQGLASEWEIGTGTVASSGTVLQRTTIRKSSNSNNKVSFSAGPKLITVQPDAADVTEALKCGIPFVIDGQGAVIATGIKGYVPIPFDCQITEAILVGDVSGSIVVDIYRSTYSAFDPPTHPATADKITGSAPPTISGAKKSDDTTLTGWTTTLAAGDVLGFDVLSCLTIKLCTVFLKALR